MGRIRDVMKVLKRLSDDELREIQNFAEFLLAKKGARTGWSAQTREPVELNSGETGESDYNDYDEFIR